MADLKLQISGNLDFRTVKDESFYSTPKLKPIQQIPWVEYIVNYGWLGQSGIWAYVVNRIQDKAAILYIPLEAFSKLENSEIPSDSVDQSKPTVDQPMETNQIKPIQMLHYWTSPYWVSVSNLKIIEVEQIKQFHFVSN